MLIHGTRPSKAKSSSYLCGTNPQNKQAISVKMAQSEDLRARNQTPPLPPACNDPPTLLLSSLFPASNYTPPPLAINELSSLSSASNDPPSPPSMKQPSSQRIQDITNQRKRSCELLLYALFNHLRLLIQVARVQKAQFSYRLDGLVP